MQSYSLYWILIIVIFGVIGKHHCRTVNYLWDVVNIHCISETREVQGLILEELHFLPDTNQNTHRGLSDSFLYLEENPLFNSLVDPELQTLSVSILASDVVLYQRLFENLKILYLHSVLRLMLLSSFQGLPVGWSDNFFLF